MAHLLLALTGHIIVDIGDVRLHLVHTCFGDGQSSATQPLASDAHR